jgi:hypothetical protein
VPNHLGRVHVDYVSPVEFELSMKEEKTA